MVDFVERQLQTLAMGYPSDMSVIVKGGERIKCHSYFLIQNSHALAAVTQMKVPQLPTVLPQHFRCILEILYIGRTKDPQDVETIIMLGHFAKEYKVLAVTGYCMKQLSEALDPDNVFGILELALSLKKHEMVQTCLQLVCQNADTALKSQFFLKHCTPSTLKLVVKQKKFVGISEIGLFEACVSWAMAKRETTRRDALASTILYYIRFRLFTPEDFARHVCPTGLLEDDVWRDILRSCATGDHKFIPKGFSTSNESRCERL
ncbi:hypothetical protein B566_EDAN015002 [Ephemera danica]|nr:hypothetical protein B566_EDAN015002 [Ephemera danica]